MSENMSEKSERSACTAIIILLLCVIGISLLGLYKLNQRIDKESLQETDYILNVVDDSLVIYHNDRGYVGTIKSQGSIDSLLVNDNL